MLSIHRSQTKNHLPFVILVGTVICKSFLTNPSSASTLILGVLTISLVVTSATWQGVTTFTPVPELDVTTTVVAPIPALVETPGSFFTCITPEDDVHSTGLVLLHPEEISENLVVFEGFDGETQFDELGFFSVLTIDQQRSLQLLPWWFSSLLLLLVRGDGTSAPIDKLTALC